MADFFVVLKAWKSNPPLLENKAPSTSHRPQEQSHFHGLRFVAPLGGIICITSVAASPSLTEVTTPFGVVINIPSITSPAKIGTCLLLPLSSVPDSCTPSAMYSSFLAAVFVSIYQHSQVHILELFHPSIVKAPTSATASDSSLGPG
jgi:hypothetical protein